MDSKTISRWQHEHDFCGQFEGAEKRTRRVLALNAVMMVVEIVGGLKLHSMALYADGWHMATHVTAFIITVGAYVLARRHAHHTSYSFGTGKIGVLGAYTSAIILGAIALFMAGQSVVRLLHPLPIDFNDAILVACVGLAINVTSALILKDHHHHGPAHGHHHDAHPGDEKENDLNLRAAYIHVIADAVTSLLAIIALVGGKFFQWFWLDPVMGIVGACVIIQWSYTLLRDTYMILLDRQPENTDLALEIRKAVETDADTVISDLHVWQLAVNKFSAIISIDARHPKPPEAYKDLLREHAELVHVTVEVNQRVD